MSATKSHRLARDEWLALIVHDLRAPLNVVLLTTELLHDAGVSDEQRGRWLLVIRRAAEQMNALVGDLLEAVRRESHRVQLDRAAHAVRPLLREVVQLQKASAEVARVSVRVSDVPADLVAHVDRAAMLRVLSNLVDNAIRFTPAGGLVLIGADRTAAGVRFTVADTGRGIEPEHLPHIFDRFWQAGHERRGSAGLGLTIVRTIVEQHGGRIAVESEPGRGTLFQVTIPDALSRGRRG